MLLLELPTYLHVSNDSGRENTGHEVIWCGAFYEVDTRLLSSLKEDRWDMRWAHIACGDGERLRKQLGYKIPRWGFSRSQEMEEQQMAPYSRQAQLSRRRLSASPPPVVGDSDDRTGDVRWLHLKMRAEQGQGQSSQERWRKGAPLMSSVEKGSIVRSPHTDHLYPCIHNFIISKLYFNYSEFLT